MYSIVSKSKSSEEAGPLSIIQNQLLSLPAPELPVLSWLRVYHSYLGALLTSPHIVMVILNWNILLWYYYPSRARITSVHHARVQISQ